MKLSNRRLWLFGAIAIAALIIITLVAAPVNSKIDSGSTYSRAPDGYGGWYAFMSERGTPVKRWQKPFQQLVHSKTIHPPITLLRVHWFPAALSPLDRKWVEKGNILVNLGVAAPVTAAPFSTRQTSAAGSVKIDTTRRKTEPKKQIIGDRFGAVVWEEKIGKGRVIFATTPHLAANAYQNERGNYELLAQILTQSEQPIWVDEYMHGYKDAEIIKEEKNQDLFSYLAKTPLFPVFVQGLILLLVLVWAQNRRFGQPVNLTTPAIDNSEAYIQALASILQKADSSELILDVVGKEEQLQVQKALGLGQVPLEPQSLVDAWVQQTGRPSTELAQLLQVSSQKRRISESDLLTWLRKWETIRRHLPS